MNRKRLLREFRFVVRVFRLSLYHRLITSNAIDDLLRDENPREWLIAESFLMPQVIGR